MKQNNRQIQPQTVRSTKEEKAGLSLQLSLFTIEGNAFIYYNESAQIISKNTSDFIARLTRKKFKNISLNVSSKKIDFFFDYKKIFTFPSNFQCVHFRSIPL